MFNLTIADYDRQVYEKELKDFLPEEIIDMHIHPYKSEFEPFGKGGGVSGWAMRVANEMTIEQMFECFQKLFPGNKVTPVACGDAFKNIKQSNDYLIEAGKTHNFPVLYRTSYDMDAEELEMEVNKGGFAGLKPYLSNYPDYIPTKEIRIFDFLPHEHLRVANKNGWPVLLHIPRDGRLKDSLNLGQLMEIEEKYPDVKLIVAHIGRAYSKEDIGDAFDFLKNTKNMYFDFAANVSDDAIRACIEAVGTKRIMFGADLPIAVMRMYRITENGFYYNIVPRGLYGDLSGEVHMRETDEPNITFMIYEQMRAMKRVAQELKLKDNEIEDIFANNAKRLFGMKAR